MILALLDLFLNIFIILPIVLTTRLAVDIFSVLLISIEYTSVFLREFFNGLLREFLPDGGLNDEKKSKFKVGSVEQVHLVK